MASVQSTILKCVLLEKGLTEKQADDIGLLLLDHRENVQQSLYYKCLGYKQKEIASAVGITQQAVSKAIKNEKIIKNYLTLVVKC